MSLVALQIYIYIYWDSTGPSIRYTTESLFLWRFSKSTLLNKEQSMCCYSPQAKCYITSNPLSSDSKTITHCFTGHSICGEKHSAPRLLYCAVDTLYVLYSDSSTLLLSIREHSIYLPNTQCYTLYRTCY